jgi:hypothetical protein
LEIYYSFTGILFIIVGTFTSVAILFIIFKYVSKIPDSVEVDYARKILKLKYGNRIVELPFVKIYCVDLTKYLRLNLGGICLPSLIAGKFKTINNEIINVYSESNKAIIVVTPDGRRYTYTAPNGLC